MKKITIATLLLTLVGMPVAIAGQVSADTQMSSIRAEVIRGDHRSVGSWFGRATPNNPPCEPGTPDCPAPKEIVMLLTFFADGTFVAIDSQTFGGGAHTTAHGQWRPNGNGTIEADWIFLQSDENNTFVGGFRMRMNAELRGNSVMVGYVNAWFMPFTDENGEVILDPVTGLPSPDPLNPVGPFLTDGNDCNPQLGCFGVFEFLIRRIAVQD